MTSSQFWSCSDHDCRCHRGACRAPLPGPSGQLTRPLALAGHEATQVATVLRLQRGARMAGTAARLLVVDDYEPNRSGLRRLLERQGYTVMTAANGHDAIEIVGRERPDLVLMDVVMPDVSGV